MDGDASPRRVEHSEYCRVCVYGSGQLDPKVVISEGICGLDCVPGDDLCLELRTRNCSFRKRPP